MTSPFSPFGFKPRAVVDPNDFAAQQALARRARGAGRRWILRGILLAVIGVIAFVRGGSLMITVGVVCYILALLAISLGQQTRKQAMAIEQKIALMKKAE